MSFTIRFSEELRPLLREDGTVRSLISDHNSVKHWIEFFDIPHTEVAAIFVEGEQKDFRYQPQEGDAILIHGFAGAVDVTVPGPLRPVAYLPHHFIVDECVGGLAPKLRMLGCDVTYDNRIHDKEIAEISLAQKRTVLTKDRGLLKRKEVIWGRLIRGHSSEDQLKEVIRFFNLSPLPSALTRCLSCNGEILPVAKEKILHQLEPKTIQFYNEFSQCDRCGKIYWEGSHYKKMQNELKTLF